MASSKMLYAVQRLQDGGIVPEGCMIKGWTADFLETQLGLQDPPVADVPKDDDGYHRCFDGSPFSRILRVLRTLQDECVIPAHVSDSPGLPPYVLRNRIAKRLDAALGYCEMSDLQHELYGVLENVSLAFGSVAAIYPMDPQAVSWQKLREQVSDAMTKIECSEDTDNEVEPDDRS